MAFYAVKAGRVPGVYATWAECEAQVKGYSGASHKKFNTLAEAQAFTGLVVPSVEVKVLSLPPPLPGVISKNVYDLWTDGSAEWSKKAGYGWVVTKNGEILAQGGGKITVPPYDSYQAEVSGMMEGLRALHNLNVITDTNATFTVYCDNEAVVKTLNEWGPARRAADWKDKAYAAEFINMLQFITAWRARSNLNVKWVSSHSGLVFNDLADNIALQYRSA